VAESVWVDERSNVIDGRKILMTKGLNLNNLINNELRAIFALFGMQITVSGQKHS
jgi:hypothetical protein